MIRAVVRAAIVNPVLLHVVFGLMVLAGALAWWQIPKEEFPQVLTDRVAVSWIWPGASPEDIEDTLVRPMEDAVGGIDGLKHSYADALQGRAIMTLEFARGTDVDAARDEVDRQINAIDNVPDDAFSPRVRIARLTIPVIHVALTGDTRQIALAERLADELRDFDGVKDVRIQGEDRRELVVRLDAAKAASHGITPDAVTGALRAAGVSVPAGSIDGAGTRMVVRTPKALAQAADLANVPLRVAGGAHLRVGDVAAVAEVWEAPDISVRVGGQPAIMLQVLRQDDADSLAMVPKLRSWAVERAATLPAGLGLVAFDDAARMVSQRLWILGSNGVVGLLLVMGVLVIFVGLRSALLVSWGVPVAYAGALAAMYVGGVTINVVSTFGFLLVIGIIVDDSVVIVENVQRHLEMGKSRALAAIDGTAEVAPAVLAATLTTSFAFAPLLMLEGTVGRVMRIIPLVVILALAASLVEAFFILPGHMGQHGQERPGGEPDNAATRWVRAVYAPVVDAVTRRGRRLITLAVLAVAVLGCLGLGAVMRRSLTTPGNPVYAFINIDLPAASDPESTRAVLRGVESWLMARAADDMLYLTSRVGEQVSAAGFPTWGDRHGQIKVGFLNDPAVLDRVPSHLDALRRELLSRPDVVAVDVETVSGGPPAGKPIDLRVRSRSPAEVEPLAKSLVAYLERRPGVRDVRSAVDVQDRWVEVQVDPGRAARLGLREADVAQAVRAAMDGGRALELAVEERTTPVRVALGAVGSAEALGDVLVPTPEAGFVRVRQVADLVVREGAERISRVDGQRSVRITAEIDDALTTAEGERDGVEARFQELAAGSTASLFYGGELADAAESFGQLPSAAALAVALIYTVLAIQFRSWLQPLIILTAVPVGMAGVFVGLFLFRMDVSLIAMIGAVGLAGIVVNDSLVLVDFINQNRDRGMSPRDAVMDACLTRVRPILITTVTTVLGLLPLAMGIAGKEPLLAPMAVAISVGLTFATALALLIVPVLYLVLDDLGSWFGGGDRGAAVRAELSEDPT